MSETVGCIDGSVANDGIVHVNEDQHLTDVKGSDENDKSSLKEGWCGSNSRLSSSSFVPRLLGEVKVKNHQHQQMLKKNRNNRMFLVLSVFVYRLLLFCEIFVHEY